MSSSTSFMPPCSTCNIVCNCPAVSGDVTSSTQFASRSVTSFACALPPNAQASRKPASTLCCVYQGTQPPSLKLNPPLVSTFPSLIPRSVDSSSGGNAPT